MSAAHEIVWEFDYDCARARVVCHAPEGANCRLAGDCECESWALERDPDGTPYHLVEDWDGDEVRHEMRAVSYCNVVEFLNQDGDIEELCADRKGSFEIGRVPIKPLWNGDGYEWERVEDGAP